LHGDKRIFTLAQLQGDGLLKSRFFYEIKERQDEKEGNAFRLKYLQPSHSQRNFLYVLGNSFIIVTSFPA